MTGLPDIDSRDIRFLPDHLRTLPWIMRARAERDSDRTYMAATDGVYTFAQTWERTRALARGMAARGLGKGDFLAVMMPNCADHVFAWYATVMRGAAYLPINTQYRDFLLEAPLRETRAKGIVIHRDYALQLATLTPEMMTHLRWVAVVGGSLGFSLPSHVEEIPFEELARPQGDDPEVEADPRGVQGVSYTSGTTGPSKGVLVSNIQTFSTASVFMRAVDLTRDDILFSPLPLFHGLASRLGVFPAMLCGARIVIGERFSGTSFWHEVAAARATVAHTIFSIPPILRNQPPGPQDRAHSLRCMYNAHHDPEFEARFGVRLVEAFGMTETGMFIFEDYPNRREGSSGRVHPEYEMRLLDANDEPVATGEPGEICVRARRPWRMMQGYLHKPEATVAAWRNLWFHTGDIARQDADGYVYFVDRVKERIRRRGENIASWDVEAYVDSHPDIAESAAVAHPAPGGEDDVRVIAVLHPGSSLTPRELSDWLAARMPRFMIPRYVEFVAELPRNPTSKVEKYKLVAAGLGEGHHDREGAPQSAYGVRKSAGSS
jgi:carnitine-CoA ligase